MNKKIIGSILMQLAIFSFVLPASANYDETYNSGVTGFESEFGSCAVDPVYQDEFIGKATVSSRIRNRACMADSEVIATVSANAEVKVKYKTDGWYRVVLSDGTAGWIGQALVARTEATDFTQKTEIAKSKAYEEKTASIKERLKGYIVLAVESKGEAYYITKEGVGVYLKDGNAAFQLMRGQGLGINNKDLDKLKNGDKNIGSRLRGRIVLAVERNGEAYYISPKNLKVYFLKNGQGAFELLRQEGMGINNANLALITKKSADETKSAVKEKNKNEDVAVSSSDGSITLDGQQSGNKVSLNWSLVGFDSSMGFKVVVSKELDPVYPGNEYHYLSDAGTRSDTWELDEPGTYFFRVCEYLGGKCGVYSNNLKVEIE